MSRAILMFRLPQERCEHHIATHAMDWALSMLDLDNWLRDELKYRDGPEEYATVRDMIGIFLDSNGISLDDIE